jgi:hypothetical protein
VQPRAGDGGRAPPVTPSAAVAAGAEPEAPARGRAGDRGEPQRRRWPRPAPRTTAPPSAQIQR